MRDPYAIKRRPTRAVKVGGVAVGGEAPVVVQSMTNTDTADVEATAQQVAALARAGSELVRITVDRDEAAAAVPHIKARDYRSLGYGYGYAFAQDNLCVIADQYVTVRVSTVLSASGGRTIFQRHSSSAHQR